jgi:hypothetical protein
MTVFITSNRKEKSMPDCGAMHETDSGSGFSARPKAAELDDRRYRRLIPDKFRHPRGAGGVQQKGGTRHACAPWMWFAWKGSRMAAALHVCRLHRLDSRGVFG